jgi:hypothetical protein
MKSFEAWLPKILILVAFLLSGFTVYISNQRTLSSLEGVLLQLFILVSGLIGSFFIGKRFARDTAREIIKPHARSAFRRLLSLYTSLNRVLVEIQSSKNSVSVGGNEIALQRLEAIVTMQIGTADDALEDWRDIIPEDVEELMQRLNDKRQEVDQ